MKTTFLIVELGGCRGQLEIRIGKINLNIKKILKVFNN